MKNSLENPPPDLGGYPFSELDSLSKASRSLARSAAEVLERGCVLGGPAAELLRVELVELAIPALRLIARLLDLLSSIRRARVHALPRNVEGGLIRVVAAEVRRRIFPVENSFENPPPDLGGYPFSEVGLG